MWIKALKQRVSCDFYLSFFLQIGHLQHAVFAGCVRFHKCFKLFFVINSELASQEVCQEEASSWKLKENIIL